MRINYLGWDLTKDLYIERDCDRKGYILTAKYSESDADTIFIPDLKKQYIIDVLSGKRRAENEF